MAKLTAYNLKVCMAVTIAAFSFGYGATSFVTSIGQPGFYIYFKLDPTSRRELLLYDQSSAEWLTPMCENRHCEHSQRDQCVLLGRLCYRCPGPVLRV